jgi:hypothetical protein
MVDKVDPRTGELVTANYGWTKPTVGASVDQWGGYINADLDGIDTTVKSVSTVANAAYPANNPNGYQTAAQVTASLGAYLPLAGAAMTGPMTLAANPAAPLQPATKQYVDALPVAINDNRIINGDMRVDQRWNGASGTAIGYTVDRWKYAASQVNKGTWGQQLIGSAVPGFPYCLGVQSSSAYTSLASDFFIIDQIIEADQVSDFAWGTPSAQPVTLTFWAKCSLTGTFSGVIGNNAQTRSYPFTYSIPAANAWAKIVVTIPGDTGGTWVMSGNAGALFVVFDLGCGATYRGPAGAWASANYFGATGAVSVISINGATFYVTGVKLEIGSVATPYNRQSLAKSMIDCQRYYQTENIFVAGYNGAGAEIYTAFLLPVVMRAAPTVVYGTVTYGNTSALSTNSITQSTLTAQAAIAATGGGFAATQTTFSAEL